MGPYVVIRVRGHKDRSVISRLYTHNERTNNNRRSNKDIDPERTWQNYHIKECKGKYVDVIEEYVARTKKVAGHAKTLIDGLVFASPEWFEGKSVQEQKAFFEYVYEYVAMIFDDSNIIDAVVHMDEATPHMHFDAVPYRNGRIGIQMFVSFPDGFSILNNGLYDFVHMRYPEFEKCIPSSKSKRPVTSMGVYKSAPEFFNLHNELYMKLSELDRPIWNKAKYRDDVLRMYSRASKVAAVTILTKNEYIDHIHSKVLPRFNEEVQEARNRIDVLEKENEKLSGELESRNRIIESLRSDLEQVDLLIGENNRYKTEMQMLRWAIKVSREDNFEEIIRNFNGMCSDMENKELNFLRQIKKLEEMNVQGK